MFATLAVLAALCFAVGGYFTKLSLGLTGGIALVVAGIILLKGGTH